jgi:hypothetical protein
MVGLAGVKTRPRDESLPPRSPCGNGTTILRHERAETTRKHYIKLQTSAEGLAAMKKLERVVGRKWGENHHRKTKGKELKPA